MLKVLFLSLLFFLPAHENENDLYIQKATSNPEKLTKCGKFESGQIFINGQTINTQILNFSKSKEINSFLFCVTKNKSDSLHVFTAKQIDGYSVGKDNYRKHISEGAFFFIRLKKNGRAMLYERSAIPSDDRFLYYIRLPKYIEYFVLAPEQDNIVFIPAPTQDNSPLNQSFYYNNPDNKNEKLKLFIKTYMSDCKDLNLLISSDYFTIFDLPEIIDKYNNCTN